METDKRRVAMGLHQITLATVAVASKTEIAEAASSAIAAPNMDIGEFTHPPYLTFVNSISADRQAHTAERAASLCMATVSS
jgi:hypothetical protein